VRTAGKPLKLETEFIHDEEGRPIFPQVNTRRTLVDDVAIMLRDYFLVMWFHTQGPPEFPWDAIEAHPDDYYDSWGFPGKIIHPDSMETIDIVNIARYLAMNTFTFFSKERVQKSIQFREAVYNLPPPPEREEEQELAVNNDQDMVESQDDEQEGPTSRSRRPSRSYSRSRSESRSISHMHTTRRSRTTSPQGEQIRPRSRSRRLSRSHSRSRSESRSISHMHTTRRSRTTSPQGDQIRPRSRSRRLSRRHSRSRSKSPTISHVHMNERVSCQGEDIHSQTYGSLQNAERSRILSSNTIDPRHEANNVPLSPPLELGINTDCENPASPKLGLGNDQLRPAATFEDLASLNDATNISTLHHSQAHGSAAESVPTDEVPPLKRGRGRPRKTAIAVISEASSQTIQPSNSRPQRERKTAPIGLTFVSSLEKPPKKRVRLEERWGYAPIPSDD